MIPTRIVVPITVLLSVLPCRGSSSNTTGGGDARAMDVVDSLPQGSHAELYVAEIMVGVSVANAGIITLTACFMFLPQAEEFPALSGTSLQFEAGAQDQFEGSGASHAPW